MFKKTELGYRFFTITHPERGPEEPGGKVEWCDETPFDTAKREFKEEVGCDVPTIDKKSWKTTYIPKSKCLVYIAEFPSDYEVLLENNKIDGTQWVEYKEGMFVRTFEIIKKIVS